MRIDWVGLLTIVLVSVFTIALVFRVGMLRSTVAGM